MCSTNLKKKERFLAEDKIVLRHDTCTLWDNKVINYYRNSITRLRQDEIIEEKAIFWIFICCDRWGPNTERGDRFIWLLIRRDMIHDERHPDLKRDERELLWSFMRTEVGLILSLMDTTDKRRKKRCSVVFRGIFVRSFWNKINCDFLILFD